MDELGVGLIGVGRMGAYHVETWERIAAGRLVAVADPDESTARARIGRRPIEWVGDYRWLLERADVDAVCICAPSEHHARIALDAIAAGKHVFVEKPIATALEDGLRMAAAARLARVKLMVGHVERFNPAVGKLAELIARGAHRARLPRPRHPRWAAARAHPGHRRGDRPRHPRPRPDAVRARPRHHLDLRRRLPLRAPLPGGPDRLPAALRRRRAARPARRQLADAGEAPRDDRDRRGRDAERLLPDAGRVVHRVHRRAHRLERARSHPRRRRGRRGALRAAARRAAAGRAARRSRAACSTTPPSPSARRTAAARSPPRSPSATPPPTTVPSPCSTCRLPGPFASPPRRPP